MESTSYRYDRKYDQRTVALLFGLSGNRCAHPDCNNCIIAEPSSFDEAAVVGHIAHIYARSSSGPRPYPNTKPSPEVINSFENLLLLCRHCHALIDEQENTYPADEIARWKAAHLAKHLRIQASLLPECHRKQVVLGLSFNVSTIDATLVSADRPVVRTVQDASGKSSVTKTEIRYWLQTDAGRDIAVDLTNMQMSCPIGGRASILFVVDENGEPALFSLLSHSTMTWLRICEPDDLDVLHRTRKPSPVTRIVLLTLCAYLIGGLIWQLSFAKGQPISWWLFVPALLLCAPILAFYKLRQHVIVKRLTSLQASVSVS